MRRASLLVLLSVGGCAPAFSFTSSTTAPFAAKEATCEFAVTSTLPAEGFEEIGIIEWKSGAAVDNAAKFKEAVRESVCKAGGDLVVTQINGVGVRGAVMRKKSS